MAAPEKQVDLQSVLRFNAELIETVEQLQKRNQELREELELYRRKLFGQSSERHVEDESQLHLFDLGITANEGKEEEPEPEPPKPVKSRLHKFLLARSPVD
jgi:serine phosphatase RsbU (regulator of sigma subunit)